MPFTWVTAIWFALAAACLTLAARHLAAWWQTRTARAHLSFAINAVAMATLAGAELWATRDNARPPDGLTLAAMLAMLITAYGLSREVMRTIQVTEQLRHSEGALREQHERLAATNQQVSDLFGRLIEAQETERTRIARDLHDDVSQRIAGLAISMSNLKRKLAAHADDTSVRELSAMQRDTAALAEEIRHVSHDLHPSMLRHTDLVSALGGFCRQFAGHHAVTVAFHASPNVGPVSAEVALCTYRVTQEALRNVAKHAAATRVDVAIDRIGERVQLVITDDGKGFDARTPQRSGGLGLVSIDERVKLLNGHTEIRSRPGAGTTLQVDVLAPVAPASTA